MAARVTRTVLIVALTFLVGVTSATRLVRTQCAMADSARMSSCCPPGAHARAAARARRAPRPTPATPVKIGVGDCCSVASVSTTSPPTSMMANPAAPALPTVAVVEVVQVAPAAHRGHQATIVPVAVGPPPSCPRAQAQIWLL